jgi:hypothetical protein
MLDTDFARIVSSIEKLPKMTKPSEITLDIWRRSADAYDPELLEPLWAYTIEQVRKYKTLLGRPMDDILLSASIAYGISKRLSGAEPDPDEFPRIAWVLKHLQSQNLSWRILQNSVEVLANKWRDLEGQTPQD